MIFQEKCFLFYILLTYQISLSDCLNFLRYWAICIAIVCSPGCEVGNFEIDFIFLIKSFFYMTKKSMLKIKYLVNEIPFKMK